MSNNSGPPKIPVKRTSANKGSNKSYQDNSDASLELKRAAKAVPLKSYDDYEIEIETKAHYEDAIFGSETDLEQALKADKGQGISAPKIQVKKAIVKDSAANTRAQPEVKEIDFDIFINRPLQQDALSPVAGIEVATGGTGLATVASNMIANIELNPDLFIAAPPIEEPTPKEELEPKDFRSKLSRFTKTTLLQGKAQFDEYSGRNLPDREITLDFIFANQKVKNEASTIVTNRDIGQLFEGKGKATNTIFKKADKDLLQLSKTKLSNSNRLELLDSYCAPLVKRLNLFIDSVERKPSSPNDAKRLELQAHCPSVLRLLITGYKQVYSVIYESSNVVYATQHTKANTIAFRIFDLLLLEQRLAQVLHMQQPLGSAKVINRLYTALKQYEPDFLNQNSRSECLSKETSIKQLFVRYQIGLAFDSYYLSSRQQKVFFEYIELQLPLLGVIADDKLDQVTQSYWLSQAGDKAGVLTLHQAPASVSAEPSASTIDTMSSHYILAAPFLNQIKLDYQEIIESITRNQSDPHTCSAFAAISKGCCLALLSTLNKLITAMENDETLPVYRAYRPIELKAFSGLESCALYFKYQYELTTRRVGKNAKKADNPEVSEKTEKTAKPIASKSPWLCADESDTTIRLQTAEHKAGILFDVGLPVLLVRTLSRQTSADNAVEMEEYEQEQLWQINRLERDPQGNIHLVLTKQADRVTYAPIKAQGAKAHPALLIASGSNEPLRLQVSNKLSINSGDVLLSYLLDKSKNELRVNKLAYATHLHQEITLN